MSHLAEALCKAMGIKRHQTTAWRPTANGLVERYNGELKGRMRTGCEEQGKRWPSFCPDFQSAHNHSVHAVTGYTPFFLMHGWEAKVPIDLLMEARDEDEPVWVQKYVKRLARAHSDAWEAARHNQQSKDRFQQLETEQVAKVANPPPVFKPGQEVLLQKRHLLPGEKKERTALWTGPFQVVKQLGEHTYEINRDEYVDVVHVDRLKSWRERGVRAREPDVGSSADERGAVVAHTDERVEEMGAGEEKRDDARSAGWVDEPEEGDESEAEEEKPLPDEDIRGEEEAEGVYEVERLLSSRTLTPRGRLGGQPRVEYLVKWKNWDDLNNSWEPEANLVESASEALREFKALERGMRAARRAEAAEMGAVMVEEPVDVQEPEVEGCTWCVELVVTA